MKWEHEPSDVRMPVVIACSGCLAVLVLAGLVLGVWLDHGHLGRLPPVATFQHGPAEKPQILRVWQDVDREERGHLHTYGWVDRKAGVVRIPIENAMRLLVRQGSGKDRP
ncbi:MAG: hypothetical protein ACREFX_01860 [Opitutaceae bacterium]